MSNFDGSEGTHPSATLYLLNALDEAAEAAFERHLTQCDRCRRECDEMSPIVLGLARMPSNELRPLLTGASQSDQTVVPRPRRPRRSRPVPADETTLRPTGPPQPTAGPPIRRRPVRLVLLGAATLAALSLGVAIGMSRLPQPGVEIAPVDAAVTVQGIQDATRLTVSVTGRGSSASVLVTIVGLRVGVRYRLYAVTLGGDSLTVKEWSGAEGVAELSGTLPVPPDELAFFAVTTDDGTAVVQAHLATGSTSPP